MNREFSKILSEDSWFVHGDFCFFDINVFVLFRVFVFYDINVFVFLVKNVHQ